MSLTPSRRRLLQATALLPALVSGTAACTHPAEQPAVVDPDVALRAAAVARELDLLAAYDGVVGAPPARAAQLAAVRAEHAAHLVALGTASPTPSATPSTTPVTVTELAARERAAAAAHAADALGASRQLAAVLASLAASEASHVV